MIKPLQCVPETISEYNRKFGRNVRTLQELIDDMARAEGRTMIKFKCSLCGKPVPEGTVYGYDYSIRLPKTKIEGGCYQICEDCGNRLQTCFEESVYHLAEEEGKILEGRIKDVGEAK